MYVVFRNQRAGVILTILIVAGVLIATIQSHAGTLDRLFAPKAKLWEMWTRHDPGAVSAIDHHVWDGFLRMYLVP